MFNIYVQTFAYLSHYHLIHTHIYIYIYIYIHRGRRDSMVVGFTTTYAISAYHLKLWVRIPLRQGVLDTTLFDKVCKWLATGWWFSPGTLISSINKADRHNITEILLKVALNIITLTPTYALLYINNQGYIWKLSEAEKLFKLNISSC